MRPPEAEVSSECAYSLPHYRYILRQAKERYWLPKVRDVADALPERDFFLIRHDVDISPWAALEMAELEHAEGVETTYYYRLHAPYYNLMDVRVAKTVERVAELGHEVGLHYEPGYFEERGQDVLAGIREDIRTFESLIGRKTHTIAQHEPAKGPVLDALSEEHGDAYAHHLVRGIPYFGDSGFHWREGCICTKFDRPQLHTLIHPHSWTIWGQPWQDVLRAHAVQLNGVLTDDMEAYIASVEVYLAERPRLDAEREARYEKAD